MTESEAPDTTWRTPYFNYFTEIEEHFQRARGTSLFLLSPLDWALIENWKSAGVPLEAVLAGIDAAFEKWRSRKVKHRSVNSLAYCAQAVAEAAQRASIRGTQAAREPAFQESELRTFLEAQRQQIAAHQQPAFKDIAGSLETILGSLPQHLADLEDLERRLTALEDKMVAIARALQTGEQIYALRAELDRELQPYRSKMSADQISMLERRYLDTRLLEHMQLPRLSLFYMR